MNQEQIKSWLEWAINTLSNNAESNMILDTHVKPDVILIWHGLHVAGIQPNEEVYEVTKSMQLAIQDEIQAQGWTFKLHTYENTPPTVVIKAGGKTLSGQRGNTILEAMMQALRTAYEATHNT